MKSTVALLQLDEKYVLNHSFVNPLGVESQFVNTKTKDIVIASPRDRNEK